MQYSVVSTTTRQWAGQPRTKVHSLAREKALLQGHQTDSRLWTCPASYSVGIRICFSGGKDIRTWSWPLTTPRVDLHPNPCHTFKACRHSITPYLHYTLIPELESGNRAATYKLVSSFQSAKYNLDTSFCKIPQTHHTFPFYVHLPTRTHTHTIWPTSPQNHAITIHKVPRIQRADITYLHDITVSAETKESTWGTNQFLRLPGRTQFGPLQFGFRIFFLLRTLWYF
jgi:hypothetical protein